MKHSGSFIRALGIFGLLASGAFALTSCDKKTDTDSARVLHIGNVGEPASLDPQKTNGVWEIRILNDMFVGLTALDAKGVPTPAMAREWKTSVDGLVWTFKLRDAKWSDGSEVTAVDFEFSLRRLFSAKPAAQYASLLFLIKNSQAIYEGKMAPDQLGVHAIDAKTLEITLNNPAPYLPGLLTNVTAMPLPKAVVEKFGDEWAKPGNMVTNGAFVLSEWAPNDYVHLVKNPNFYDASNVCLNELYFYPTQDDAAAERGVKSGKYDIQTSFPGNRLEELNRTLPGYARVAPYVATTYFQFNSQHKPFDDERVREALSMTINREFITEQILKGGQKAAYSLIPPGISQYKSGEVAESWKSLSRPARLEAARKLLQAAGFGPNKPLKFTFRYRNSGDSPRFAPIVQQNWQDIGPWVSVEIVGSDLQINYEKLRQGDFDVSDAAWVADFDDARNFLYNFETSALQMNYGKYSNPIYDNLLIAADKEIDGTKRMQILQKAEKLVLEDNILAPMYYSTSHNLVNPRITGWLDNPQDVHPSRYLCLKQKVNICNFLKIKKGTNWCPLILYHFKTRIVS